MTREELQAKLQMAAAQVKLATGIGNNAAWAACLEAHDHIKQHCAYRHLVKRAYKAALDEFHDYERRLIHAQQNRMFHMADMSEKTRKIYGNITDREYYDFWAATGDNAYHDSRPLVTSLVNKYRLSLVKHDVRQSDLLAWPMAALACLELARQIYKVTLQVVIDTYNLPRPIVDEVFKQFSLHRVTACWKTALMMTDPKATEYPLDTLEERNIALGIEQLQDAWVDTSKHLTATAKTMINYEEVFRTKGEMKKAIRVIEDLRDEIYNDGG